VELVVGEKTDKPEAFIAALFAADGGHLAYLYDLIGELDAPRRAFALGLWIQGDRARRDRFRALASTIHSTLGEWDLRQSPFARPIDDIAWMLLNVTVGVDGAPRGPVDRQLWGANFDSVDVPDPGTALKEASNVDRDGVIDAAWLAERVLAADPKERKPRLQQLAYGLRVFPTAARGSSARC